MQALKLDAVSGWRWVTAGWRLFRKQPFSFAALFFFYWLVLLSASAIIGWIAQAIGAVLPFVSVSVVTMLGSLLVAMLTPALTVGFLQACRVADSGLAIQPLMLFAPLRAGRRTVLRLLTLGAVQMLALVCILLLTTGTDAFRPDPPGDGAATTATVPARATGSGDPPTPVTSAPVDKSASASDVPTEAEQKALTRMAFQRLAQGLAYLPIALLMWYAPMLVAWHELPPGKAMFFSLVAVWRNRGAFVVYGVAWLAIWILASIGLAIVTTVVGVGNVAAIVAAPLAILLLTCMYCSVYPSYATVFVDPDAAPGPEAPVAVG
ncbi:MAG: BPSS1780 family membrane protein [Burkholderiaceae bacterium]